MPRELPTFEYSRRVSSATAKHDRISLEVGKWFLHGSVDDIQQLRDRMSVPNRIERTWEEMDWSGYAMIFNRPPSRGALSFRSSPLNFPDSSRFPPTWAGKWRFDPFPLSPPTTQVAVSTQLDASFNPTRHVRNQHHRRVIDQSGQFTGSYIHATRFDVWNVQRSFDGEFSLDGSDNWLPCGDILEASTHPNWSAYLRESYERFLAHFENEIQRMISHHSLGVHVHLLPYINIQETETYWEFASSNPWSDINGIISSVNEFSTRHRSTRTFENLVSDEGSVRHSRSITIQAGAGRELVVYAKTNRRIRFEVRHRMTGRNPFRVASGDAPIPREGNEGGAHVRNRHTSNNREQFFQFMDAITNDASAVVNSILEAVESRRVARPFMRTGIDLLTAIQRSCADLERANTLVHLLAHDRMIHRSVLPESFESDLEALRQAGVLSPSSEGPAPYPYVVTADYEGALQVLHQLAQPLTPQARFRSTPLPQARVRPHP